jgi:hypothetical protein
MIRLSPGYERTTKTNSILIWMIYPAYSIYWIARYAGEQSTWTHKIGMFTAFLPILGLVSVLWGSVVYAILAMCYFALENYLR